MRNTYLQIACFTLITAVLITISLGTVFTNTIDTSTPAGTDAPSVIDNRIREAKAGWQERLNVDHACQLTGTQVSDPNVGEHRKVTYASSISDPTQVSGNAHLYLQSDELRWQDDTNAAFNLTDGGTLNITSADLLGALANDTYLTAIDAAGTSTVDLIKADTNDVAVLPDDSQTATSAAPTFSKSIANKQYVDDSQDLMTPETYAGGENVTFGNGFTLKVGSVTTDGSGEATVTFGAAFGTAIGGVTLTPNNDRPWLETPTIYSLSTSGFTLGAGSYTTRPIYYIAFGY